MQDFNEPRTFPNMDPRSMQQSDPTRVTFFHTGKRDREREASCSSTIKRPHYISETDENVVFLHMGGNHLCSITIYTI
jgi:hypothetical protein